MLIFSFHTKKYSEIDATKEAAKAIADRRHEMSSNEKFDRMMKMRAQEEACSTMIGKFKHQHKKAKIKGATSKTVDKPVILRNKRRKH